MKPLYDNSNVNWEAQIQVESNRVWYDVIFHKKYRDKIMVVYEYCGVPTTIYALVGEVRVRNKPIVHKKTLYLILFKSGWFQVYSDEQERKKVETTIKHDSYHLRDIDFEWEP